MSVFHSVYGLRVRANVAIPGLTPAPHPGAIDLDIHLAPGAMPSPAAVAQEELRGVADATAGGGEPDWRMWRMTGGGFRIRYADDTEFVVDAAGTAVRGGWKAPLTLEDTATYLLGPILRLVLRLRGTVCLHASAVVIDGRAIALAGPAGAGKSTTAAAFAARGVPVLSDDLVALSIDRNRFLVQPGYPLVRLWPDAAGAAGGGTLPRLTPNWDKRFLALTGESFARQAVPLAVVYLIADSESGGSAPCVSAVPARDALMSLVGNSGSAYTLAPSLRAREFAVLGRLSRDVPIRRLVPHSSLACVQRVCDVIADDVRAIAAGMAGGRPLVASR